MAFECCYTGWQLCEVLVLSRRSAFGDANQGSPPTVLAALPRKSEFSLSAQLTVHAFLSRSRRSSVLERARSHSACFVCHVCREGARIASATETSIRYLRIEKYLSLANARPESVRSTDCSIAADSTSPSAACEGARWRLPAAHAERATGLVALVRGAALKLPPCDFVKGRGLFVPFEV